MKIPVIILLVLVALNIGLIVAKHYLEIQSNDYAPYFI